MKGGTDSAVDRKTGLMAWKIYLRCWKKYTDVHENMEAIKLVLFTTNEKSGLRGNVNVERIQACIHKWLRIIIYTIFLPRMFTHVELYTCRIKVRIETIMKKWKW